MNDINCSSSKRPIQSITFKATSNNVTPTRVRHKEASLRDIIHDNTTFQMAMKDLNPQEKVCRVLDIGDDDDDDDDYQICQDPPIQVQFLQSSFVSEKTTLVPEPLGLVGSITKAYNGHHNLILRPDDIWQGILTQFSFYVNENAESLREKFVDFDGKKEIIVESDIPDFGNMAERMVTEQISKNLKDAAITEWLLPKFSTTHENDRVVASVTIMSTLKAYFEYSMMITCGIPEVTLEGTIEDWYILRKKIDNLPNYDIDGQDSFMLKWHGMLAGVLDEFILSVEGNPNLDFWDKVASYEDAGSGPIYLSGWVNVFACFNAEGKWQGDTHEYRPSDHTGNNNDMMRVSEWPVIDTTDLPIGAVSVPVKIKGLAGSEEIVESRMIAGQMSYIVKGENMDTIQPRSDWAIAIETSDKVTENH